MTPYRDLTVTFTIEHGQKARAALSVPSHIPRGTKPMQALAWTDALVEAVDALAAALGMHVVRTKQDPEGDRAYATSGQIQGWSDVRGLQCRAGEVMIDLTTFVRDRSLEPDEACGKPIGPDLACVLRKGHHGDCIPF